MTTTASTATPATTKPPHPGDERRIGVLWIKEGRSGNKYLSGYLKIDGKETAIVVFKNPSKAQDNHPDYEILRARPINNSDILGDQPKAATPSTQSPI
jgi:hypothetical protein